jgi:hypothetical protein
MNEATGQMNLQKDRNSHSRDITIAVMTIASIIMAVHLG